MRSSSVIALASLCLLASIPACADTTSTITGVMNTPGLCFDIPAKAVAAGSRIQMWTCNGGANQQFDFVTATGQVKVYAGTANEMCWNAAGNSSANFTEVILWPCNNQANEQWAYNPNTKAITGINGACLNLTGNVSVNGTLVQLYQCNGLPNEQFNLGATVAPPPPPPPPSGTTPAGVVLPSGWSLKQSDMFGTAGNVTNFSQLHAEYLEGQWYNTNAAGLVDIPNVVINKEQETYSHFETAIAFSSDHLTIQARGHANGVITSAEIMSLYKARNFCVEARYTTPNVMYAWPAFWQYGGSGGNNTSSEIDVEQPITGNQGTTSVSLYNHPTEGTITIVDPRFTSQWMTWTNPSFAGSSPHYYTTCDNDTTSVITRYIDGKEIYQSSGWIWNASLGKGNGTNASTILNLAVGGTWPGNTPNPATFSADMNIYSVQYYGP
jgi:hypothetical protein